MASQEEYLSRILALYNKYGVRGLSLEHTAQLIGVTKRTLYNNFGTRQELLVSIINQSISECHDKMIEIASHTEHNAIAMQVSFLRYLYSKSTVFSEIFTSSLAENFPDTAQLLRDETERKLKEFWAMNIPRGRSDGLYRTDFDIDIIASFVFNGLESNFRQQESKTIQNTIAFLLHGICTPQGASIILATITKQ